MQYQLYGNINTFKCKNMYHIFIIMILRHTALNFLSILVSYDTTDKHFNSFLCPRHLVV